MRCDITAKGLKQLAVYRSQAYTIRCSCGQIIGQNVKLLWQQKLELQEAAKNMNVNITVSVPDKKKGKAAAEDEEE